MQNWGIKELGLQALVKTDFFVLQLINQPNEPLHKS